MEKIFLFHLVVTKWNRPTPKVNRGLFTSSRPNLQQISVLRGQNHLLSNRSCPRSSKKTKSNTRLIGLSPGLCPCGAVDTEQSENSSRCQCVGRRRILGLKIMSFCEEKGSMASKLSFLQSTDLSSCHDSEFDVFSMQFYVMDGLGPLQFTCQKLM